MNISEDKIREIVKSVLSSYSDCITVAIGSDHGGYELKSVLIKHLSDKGISVKDVGTNSKDSVDYPDFALYVAEEVHYNKAKYGIIIDGAGIGSCITANKLPNIRAALCYDVTTATIARQHDDANILTLGGQVIGPHLAKEIVNTFLTIPFEGGRHQLRIDKILNIEKKYMK